MYQIYRKRDEMGYKSILKNSSAYCEIDYILCLVYDHMRDSPEGR